MKPLIDFHDAERKLIAACKDLVDERFDDLVGYELLVRVHMRPWLRGICQVAFRLAESDLLGVGARSGSVRALARIHASAR